MRFVAACQFVEQIAMVGVNGIVADAGFTRERGDAEAVRLPLEGQVARRTVDEAIECRT